ncbi:MAG: hypothetical protein IJ334_18915 [Clostridia bacterium]|nr:hypothetical protein [Clostridia bacterium]
MKKFIIGVGILAALFLLTWGICEISGSDYYNYSGYILEVGENENGDTTIVTLSGNVESSFTMKWYSKMKAPKKQPIAVGDRVMLSTTHYSDTNIKKIKVEPGYSIEGRLVYVDGLSCPFVLAIAKETGVRYLVSIVGHNDSIYTDIGMCDIVKVYHMFPISTSTATVSIEAIAKVADGSMSDLTADDISFIESKGYTVRGGEE